jgi:voltage-gated potassium channel Kch
MTSMPVLAGKLLPSLSIMLCGAFLLFFGRIVPLRLMSVVLPAVQHDEKAYLQRLGEAPAYAGQFYLAVIAENPLFSITSLLVLIFLIATPLIVKLGGKVALLNDLVGPDQILFIFTLLAAWISPIIYAGVHVDRTFGSYFNSKLANLILSVRDHLVVLGFGDLGQRVVNRELAKNDDRYHQAQRRRRWGRKTRQRPAGKWLEKIVSPDLHIEYLCVNQIIVDRNSDNFLFTTSNDVLGTFGVVGALEKSPSSTEPAAARRRVLVPIVQGDATEPFTLSRVNLERASFLISTVSQDERIRDIFSHAVEVGLRTIICVSRSNQIVNLSHKAPGQPITLVYPKQNSGATLGQRLIAAALKVQLTLPKEQTAPRIIVVGMNKSNHFMLEMFWHNLSGLDDVQKAKYFFRNLRFIITGKADIYTVPRERDEKASLSADSCFTRIWRSTYVTGFRHFQKPVAEHVSYFSVPTCVMQTDEAGVLERCYDEFRPDIVVINDDEVEKSRMLLLWSVNCLERIKSKKADFRLPLLLMGTARGDEIEQKDTGDVFQFYEALMHLYQDDRGPGYPRHAYFRRQSSPHRLIGDSVQDSLADTEEIISGIRDNWEQASGKSSTTATPASQWSDVFELNTCLSDTAGSLARLTGRLAGLEFSPLAEETLVRIFPGENAPSTILQPSFQYIRHLKLDVEGHGFCLTGFADLQESTKEEMIGGQFNESAAIAMRAYAKEVHNDMNHPGENPALQNLPAPRLLALTTEVSGDNLDVQTFIEVLTDASQPKTTQASPLQGGEAFCPGMASCPIASYQHSIIANNAKALAAWRREQKNPRLRAAASYGCAKIPRPNKAAPHSPHSARLFYCCHSDRDNPGLIAVALNLLNFQRVVGLHERDARQQNLEQDWIVNIAYFKDSACHNRLFSLNRLFGARRYTKDLLREHGWNLAQYEQHMQEVMPFSLLQIMPVGGPVVARRWFDYAVALYRFLNALGANPFCFQWWDQLENQREELALTLDSLEYPIAIQINKLLNERPPGEKTERCEFCGVEDKEGRRGCAKRRPWLEPE